MTYAIQNGKLINNVPKFPSMPSKFGRIDEHVVKEIYMFLANQSHKYKENHMLNLKASSLKFDATFAEAKSLTLTEEPIHNKFNVLNEYQQVIAFWLSVSECYRDYLPLLKKLNERLKSLGCNIQTAYVDCCCKVRDILKEAFPDLTDNAIAERVLLDIFHFMKRYADDLNQKHPLFNSFMNDLRDAIFINDPDDVAIARQALVSNLGFTQEEANLAPFSRLNSRGQIKRRVPEKNIVKQNIQAVVDAYKSMPDAVGLVGSAKFDESHSRQMKHVEDGCISDHPDVNYYYIIQESQDGTSKNTLYACIRSTSPNENHHRISAAGFFMVTNLNLNTYLVRTMDYIFRSNIRQGIKFGLYADYKSYALHILHDTRILYNTTKETIKYEGQVLEEFECIPQSNSNEIIGYVPLLYLDNLANADIPQFEATSIDSETVYLPQKPVIKYPIVKNASQYAFQLPLLQNYKGYFCHSKSITNDNEKALLVRIMKALLLNRNINLTTAKGAEMLANYWNYHIIVQLINIESHQEGCVTNQIQQIEAVMENYSLKSKHAMLDFQKSYLEQLLQSIPINNNQEILHELRHNNNNRSMMIFQPAIKLTPPCIMNGNE